MTRNTTIASPFLRLAKKEDSTEILNASPFVKTVPSEDDEATSPFNRPLPQGEDNNILKVSPFLIDGQIGDGSDTIFRAYYTLQQEQTIYNDGVLILEGELQIIPVKGGSENVIINETPFGDVELKEGATVTLYGSSDTNPPTLKNKRDRNYGCWLNGSVTFYEGYTIQLQLVKIGNYLLWLQISKNF
jgi:hypothetical protein